MPEHDPRVPVWVIGHNPNTLEEVRAFLDAGANAIEPDIQIDAATGFVIVAHDAKPDTWTSLDVYLEGIREIAQRDDRLTMIVSVVGEHLPALRLRPVGATLAAPRRQR